MFNERKIKYWLTEFETTGLIWVVRKIKHMFNAFRNRFQMFIYTDYSITIFIIKQTNLTTNNTDRIQFPFRSNFHLFISIRIRCEAQTGKITRNTRRFVSFVHLNTNGNVHNHRKHFRHVPCSSHYRKRIFPHLPYYSGKKGGWFQNTFQTSLPG